MTVDLLFPESRRLAVESLPALARSLRTLPPFDPALVDAAADLSQRLFRSPAARRRPELQALAFWMRKAELQRLRQEFAALESETRILVPRGLVFHLPPRNVDTMFVYSWLLSALGGNANVIRLSPERSDVTNVLLDLFHEALSAAAEPVRRSAAVVSYGHEQEPTDLLSSVCDVRTIWGGDATVSTIRRSPLGPHARETTFADRFSMAAIRSSAYLELAGGSRNRLADDFLNDSLWFNQLACSSPRLVVWCGGEEEAAVASADLFTRLARRMERRGFSFPPAVAMQKLVFSCGAILDMPVKACRRYDGVTVLTLESLECFRRDHPGGGLFFEVSLPRLEDLSATLSRRDQTLAWFGFEREELLRFARTANNLAVDRMAPIGQALQFHRFWDGYDLLQEFCRHVHMPAAPPLQPIPD